MLCLVSKQDMTNSAFGGEWRQNGVVSGRENQSSGTIANRWMTLLTQGFKSNTYNKSCVTNKP